MKSIYWMRNHVKHPRTLYGANLVWTSMKSQQESLSFVPCSVTCWSWEGKCCETESDFSASPIFLKLTLKKEHESPVKTLPGGANYFMPDRECLLILRIFFSSQLIVLPKLNDLFLELKEMQCTERNRQSLRQRRKVVRGKAGKRQGFCLTSSSL